MICATVSATLRVAYERRLVELQLTEVAQSDPQMPLWIGDQGASLALDASGDYTYYDRIR